MRLIDADALEIEGWILYRNREDYTDSRSRMLEYKKIIDVPTVEGPHKGKWILEPYDIEHDIWVHRCGECLKVSMLGGKVLKFNFCPNCGADMGDKS